MADDQPMWGNNQAVEPTLRAAIVTVDLGDNFTVKVVEVLTHLQSVTTSLWEVPKMKKPTMPTKLIEDEDIEETTTVGVLEIGETINQEMKTRTRNLEKTHLSFHQHLKRCSTNSTLKKPYSGLTHDPPVNPNAKTTVIYDDSDDEAYKPKILYPQCLRKEKMEEHYANFIDLIKEVRINIPLIDVLAGMPNYKKFLRDLVSNKRSDEYLTLVDLGASIKLMPYTLCALLSGSTLKPTRMRVGDDRITFLIDKAIGHSHSYDDTCFRMDVIDEITEEEFDALLDDSKPFSTTSEKISESSLDYEFEEFMAIKSKKFLSKRRRPRIFSKYYPLREIKGSRILSKNHRPILC
nr:hypothetical protein [Tanacetum cinerariifolium]